jgi:hypothetical protein
MNTTNTTILSQVVTANNGLTVTPGANSTTLGFNATVGAYPSAVIGRFLSGSVTVLSLSGSGMVGTGSFDYLGNIRATSFTGSLFGTASWAQNAVTASYVLNAISSSFAATASSADAFNVRNDLKVTGSIFQSGSGIAAALQGSGSGVFTVDGVSGRLFQIDDTLSGSLFSVNTAAGLPIIEAFSDNTVRIGQYGQQVFFVSQSSVGIGKESLLNGKLDVSGSAFITGSLNVSQGVTASLFGTASWANNATTASNALTASFVLNAVSASFASTASFVNPLVQTVLITGSLNVTGSSTFNGTLTVNGDVITTGSFRTSTTDYLSGLSPAKIEIGTGLNVTERLFDFGEASRGGLTGLQNGGNEVRLGFNLRQLNAVTESVRFQLSAPFNGGSIIQVPASGVSFAPTSGTSTFTTIISQPTINQTGGANGITRGLYVSPTLTAAADWRSIEWSNNSGWGLYGAGTAANYLEGDTYIGTTSLSTATKFTIAGSETASSAIARGTLINTALTASANNDVLVGLDINPTFNNGAFTGVSNLGLRVQSGNVGIGIAIPFSGATVNPSLEIGNGNLTVRGYAALGPIANNGYGAVGSNYYLDASNALRRKNLDSVSTLEMPVGGFRFSTAGSGAANSVISLTELMRLNANGNLLIGTTTDAGFRLDVSGSTRITNNLTVSGSTLLTGSVQVTGSLTAPNITGSLFGTASWAVNATTASFVLNAVSASFAATASSADNFLIRQNATASNLLVNNTITAQTLVVQTVTSSIVYSSGSNIFGNQLTDVQQFTGSLRVTGSGNHFIMGGNVGINTTSPSYGLEVNNQFRVGNSSGGVIVTGDGGSATIWTDISSPLRLGTNNAENVRIASGGNVGINNTAPAYRLDVTGDGNFSANLTATGSIKFPSLSNSNQVNVVGYDTSTGQLFYQTTSSLSVTSASYAATSSHAVDFTIQNTLNFAGTLTDYATVISSVAGSNNLFTQATGSYTSGFFKYTVSNGANARTGEMLAVWNGASVQFTDNSTLDIGSTTPVTCSVSLVGSDVLFNVQTNTSGWRIKSIGTFM